MSTMTPVQQLVYAMLTESTGTHMSDSGGAYGRNWERNQNKSIDDFNNEEVEQVTVLYVNKNDVDFERTVSVFHWLSNSLELDDVCNEFNTLNTDVDAWSEYVYGVSPAALRYLKSIDAVIGDAYNTYKGDSDLSQILIMRSVDIDAEPYVLVQVHGGCDARGGYTDAKLFKIDNDYDDVGGGIVMYMTPDELLNEIEQGHYGDEFTDHEDNVYSLDYLKHIMNGGDPDDYDGEVCTPSVNDPNQLSLFN